MAPTVAFAAVAELEREYILQRQREGIAIAKTKSQYTRTQADTAVGQLRAGCFPMACRRDYRNRGYVAD